MQQLRKGQAVKHKFKNKKLHEATFEGYTPTGKARVTHNMLYPYGVAMVTDSFKAENIVPEHEHS
jgi:hypothetical protein